jgi:hypothetical protein
MGDVIRFPDEAGYQRGAKYADSEQPATVIILPVIRIERNPDGSNSEPQSGSPAGRRRRRRVAR